MGRQLSLAAHYLLLFRFFTPVHPAAAKIIFLPVQPGDVGVVQIFLLQDPGRRTDRDRIGGHIRINHRVRTDPAVVPHPDAADDLGARADIDLSLIHI